MRWIEGKRGAGREAEGESRKGRKGRTEGKGSSRQANKALLQFPAEGPSRVRM